MKASQNQVFEEFSYSGKYQINNTVTKTPIFQISKDQKVIMETSFQENAFEDHAKAIWFSSVLFLKNCVKNKFDEKKGFNDEQIFNSELMKDEMNEKIDILILVAKNSILSENQKNVFHEGLKHEENLKILLERLNELYCEQILEQIIVIFYEAWERFLIFKQTTKLSEELAKFLAPSFTNILENIDQIKNEKQKEVFLSETDQVIVSKADDAGEEISGCYFISTKMRFLNLKQAETISNRSNLIRKQFGKFIQVITRAVFLCSFGCLFHPNGQNQSLGVKVLESLNDPEEPCDLLGGEVKPCRKRRKD